MTARAGTAGPRDAEVNFREGANGTEDQGRMLNRVTAILEELASREGWDLETSFRVNLVMEELLLNSMTHGALVAGTAPAIRARLESGDREVTLEVMDRGRPFDPTADAPPPPDMGADAGSIPLGGLGIHLARSMALRMDHVRRDGWNRTTVIMERNPAGNGTG